MLSNATLIRAHGPPLSVDVGEELQLDVTSRAFSSVRAAVSTRAPRSASTRAVSSPMPEVAPVTSIVRPSRSSPAVTASAVDEPPKPVGPLLFKLERSDIEPSAMNDRSPVTTGCSAWGGIFESSRRRGRRAPHIGIRFEQARRAGRRRGVIATTLAAVKLEG